MNLLCNLLLGTCSSRRSGREGKKLWDLKQDEETRKVQFTGGSTYIISLPKSWVEQNRIKKGSFIKLRAEEGGLLTIFPSEMPVLRRLEELTIVVCSNDDTSFIAKKIVGAYLSGYNSIRVKAEKSQLPAKQRHELKNFVRRMLVGTEIVTDTVSQLVLQVLLSYPELTVQNALRRMSIIATSMHEDAMVGLKTNDKLLAKDVISTDNEVDRFNLYVIRLLRGAIQNPRIIKEIGLSGSDDCLVYRLVTKSVERTADNAASMAENVLSLSQDLNNEVVAKIENMSGLATKMFGAAMESLFCQDQNTAETVMGNLKDVGNLEKDAVNSLQLHFEEDAKLRLIIESIHRTAEYACDIAEIVLNLK